MSEGRPTFPEQREVAFQGTILRITSPAPRDAWQALLEADANSLVTQTPAWLDCICQVNRCEDASGLYETPDGRQLVLPMVRRRRGGPFASQASLPSSWGFGGLVAAGMLRVEDVAAVFADLAAARAVRTSLRPNPLAARVWAAARPPAAIALPRLAHILDLEGGFARVWTKRFKGSTRTAVRKAERLGVAVERDTSGRLVPVFYELFEHSLKRWAGKQHEPLWLARWRGHRRDPRRKLETIARLLGEAFRLWVAWVEERPAAAILVLQGPNAHYMRNVMDQDLAGPSSANDLLHRMAIEEACEAGCRYYHMGETGSSATLAAYKARFGAEPHRYAKYYLERLPITNTDRRLRRTVKRAIGFRD